MKIQTVEYRRLVTGPGYNNLTVGATASLGADETPIEALTDLEDWVNQRIAELRQGERDLREAERIQSELTYARSELEAIQNEVREARDNYYDKVLPFMRRFKSIIAEADRQAGESQEERLDDVPF
jgi:uncharacterized protein (DUF3084 family)